MKAEYIAIGGRCAQVLWMQQNLDDYGMKFKIVPIYCDNTSSINLSKNLIEQSRTKHIHIRYPFLKDHV